MYPNPASSRVQLFMNGGFPIQGVRIFNLSGQEMPLGSVRLLDQSAEFEIDHLPNEGLYLIEVQTEAGVAMKKLQVTKNN